MGDAMTRRQQRNPSSRGFTLIEVAVVMAVAAILAAVAIPNYSEYVMRSHRSAVQSFISDVASRQSQFFLDRRRYRRDRRRAEHDTRRPT